MIRHRQIQTQELEDRADQPLGLTQRQPEHRSQRQGRPDRQSRIVRLTASCRARLGPPGGNRLLSEPDSQTSALAQAGVVLGPVRHPVSLLRDAVTASGIGFERHGRYPTGGAQSSYVIPFQLPTRLFVQQSHSLSL